MFDIPVALFLFKRFDTLVPIFKQLEQIKPKVLYLIADQGRNEEERIKAQYVRDNIESLITWNCQVIKDYADENRGVYGNIAVGASRVLDAEKWAIFLEDDNFPSISFFDYCREMLHIYEQNPRVLWVCGTNYLTEYSPAGGASYVFTKQLMPCGWASWSHKFLAAYDYNLDKTDRRSKQIAKSSYKVKRLYYQQLFNIEYELCNKVDTGRFFSWDYHMAWTLRTGDYYGIAPAVNLIKNIGVDSDSEHGGTSLEYAMTNRFCSMDGLELSFPLVHPKELVVDPVYEKKIERILLYPLGEWLGVVVKLIVYKVFGVSLNISIRQLVKGKFERKNGGV